MTIQGFENYFPVSIRLAGREKWKALLDCTSNRSIEKFSLVIARKTEELALPPFLSDLASLEYAYRDTLETEVEFPDQIEELIINPSLQLMDLQWNNLIPFLFAKPGDGQQIQPENRSQYVIIWRDPNDDRVRIRECLPEELLVLKMLVEDIDRTEAAEEGNVPVGYLDTAFNRAIEKGILLSPGSGIRRDESMFTIPADSRERFLSAKIFTFQWHITQECDLHCKHCYDRTRRASLSLDQGLAIMDQMRDFIRDKHVRGQISFSGGNPLLHPNFLELYQGAVDRGFNVAILGNPTTRERVKEINNIRKPVSFQLSLEGMREHNDSIRGEGHFERVVNFLDILKESDIASIIMLTLTKANMDQVIPLAEFLKDRVDNFTFNRLSLVGEGADLELPSREKFRDFLRDYHEAAAHYPIIGLKDNLLNIIRFEQGGPLFGGCSGYGCGAAFNFVCLLPDGEVHACRKFPSLIGNLNNQTLTEIYNSENSAKYRAGSEACQNCRIRPNCGGCPAVAYSFGLDIFRDCDPFCFLN